MSGQTLEYRHLVTRSVYWQAGGRLAGQAFSWLASIFVVRILAPTDYGLAAMAGIVTNLLAMVALFGISASAIQVEKLDREQLRHMAGVVYALHGAAFLLTFLGAPLVALAFHEPRVEPIMRASSFMFLLMALYVLPEALLERDLRFREKTATELLATVAGAMTSLGVALAGGGVWALIGSILMLHAVKALLFNVQARAPLSPLLSIDMVRPFVRFGSLVMLAQIANYVLTTSDIAIGGRVLGKERLGLYVVTLTVASVPLDKFMPAITKVSFAALSRIQTEPDRVIRNVLRGVRLSSLLAFPFFFGLAAAAPDIIPLVLGDKWNAIITPLRILCIIFPLRAVASLLAPSIFAVGRPGVNLTNTLAGIVIMSTAFLLGVQNGVIGLTAAWAFGYPLVFLIIVVRALRTLHMQAPPFIAAVAPAAIAATLMGGAVLALGSALSALPALLRVAVLVLAGMAAYGALLLPFRRTVFADLGVLFRRGN